MANRTPQPPLVRPAAEGDAIERIAMQSWAFNTDAHAAFQRWGCTSRLITLSLDVAASAPAPSL